MSSSLREIGRRAPAPWGQSPSKRGMERTPVESAAALRGRNVVVLGAARSGVAAARLLLRLGARVTLADRSPAVLAAAGLDPSPGWRSSSDSDPSLVDAADLVVVSPGVPLNHPALVRAHLEGVRVTGELELGARLAKAPLCCVTGTNGKTTTVEWIGALLTAAGFEAPVVGNVGRPLSDWVLETPASAVLVVEVSSFQLETAAIRPATAVLLNVEPDHLDRHLSLEHYTAVKMRLFARQGPDETRVLPAGWDLGQVPGQARTLTFGVTPELVEEGATVVNGTLVRRFGGVEEALLPAQELALAGRHNLENALAAVAAVAELGLPAAVVADVLRAFRGLPHRLEVVGELAGVTYVNDSKATNVDALLSALSAYPAGRVHVLVGGRDKDGDFAPVVAAAQQRAATVYLFGEARAQLERWFGGYAHHRSASLEEAFGAAAEAARPGQVVLLSPGCASFDAFASFEERGECFRALVEALGRHR